MRSLLREARHKDKAIAKLAVGVSCPAHIVSQHGVAVGVGQQHLDNLGVAVLAGAHERRGAVLVLTVDLRPRLQQQPHHVRLAVTHRQHQGRLTRLAQHTGSTYVQ